MKRFMVILLLLASGSGIYFYSKISRQPAISGVSFTLIDGRRLNMQQLHGRPLLVTFWATTCASCLKEIPDLVYLYHKYSKKGLQIIAVAMPYDRPDYVLDTAKSYRLPYPVALDIDAKIVREFGNIQVTPNNFLIAPDGSIIEHHIGRLNLAATEQWLQSM